MKRIVIKSLTVALYILVLLWFVDFQVKLLIDLKSMTMVIFGTILLTLSSYKKGMNSEDLVASAKWNSQVTAYLTTFLLQFALLSKTNASDQLLNAVALNCRPLLYALVLYALLNNLSENIAKKGKMMETLPAIEQPLLTQEVFQTINTKYELTERESEIAWLIVEGKSNKQMAEILCISENTVKKHVSNLFRKLNVQNRQQLKNFYSK